MSAFVQLYPISPNDMSGPEVTIIFWRVEGFVDESGEIMNGIFLVQFSNFNIVFSNNHLLFTT